MLKPDAKIAVVNRGEPAVRFLNAVQDINAEFGYNLKTIALYTTPDRRALFVQRADQAYHLGADLEPDEKQVDEQGQAQLRSPYLIYDRLLQGLKATGADAVWPGWGFVSEHAEFVDLMNKNGIQFLGPTGDTMRMLGDKIGSKLLAEQSGVAVSPWSGGAVEDVKAAKAAAKQIGYPLVIKATAGGGGRGIRAVHQESELADAFASASSEALKAFGDGTVFMEQMVVDARHLEVQILADYHGAVWPVGVRDCSVQRRNQKVIEEGPAAIIDADLEQRIKDAAVAIAKTSNYRNAGTAEFLYKPDEGIFYFMEMNTRLQVEHPVTEATTGIDMVKMQIRTAMGETLKGDPPPTKGHAIEVRLNAEDPYNQFAPSPGLIENFSPPGGAGVRVDSGFETNSEIPSAFDSMIAKIIVYGENRQAAVARLVRALNSTQVVIRDGTTNKAFLLELAQHPDFVANQVTTKWLDRLVAELLGADKSGADAALILAAVEYFSMRLHEKRHSFFHTVARGRTRKLPMAEDVVVELKLDGNSYKIQVGLLEPDVYRIHMDGQSLDVRLERDSEHKRRLFYNQRKLSCTVTPRRGDLQVEVEGRLFLVEQDSGGVLKSQSPAMVLKVHVQPGERVAEGDPLISLEAMKMEMLFLSPSGGVVRELFVRKGDQVGAGDPMLVVEDDSGDQSAAKGDRTTFAFGSLPETRQDAERNVLKECRSFMMGFDANDVNLKAMLEDIPEVIRKIGVNKKNRLELIQFFKGIFEVYFDIEFLFLKTISVSTADISSPEQNFFMFLQLLHSDQEHPAQDFLPYLTKALSHYGVTLDSPLESQEEALIRICYSHHNIRLKQQLLRQIHDAFFTGGTFKKRDRDLKQSVEWILESSRANFKSIHAIASDFYNRFFQEAVFDNATRPLDTTLDPLFERLAQEEDPETRNTIIKEIIAFRYSLFRYILGRYEEAAEGRRRHYLEVLVRRVNLDLSLRNLDFSQYNDDIWFASAEYNIDRKSYRNLSFAAKFAQLQYVLGEAFSIASRNHGRHQVVLDLYLTNGEASNDQEYADLIQTTLNQIGAHPQVVRLRFVIQDKTPTPHFFHFRLETLKGYVEKRVYRGTSEFLARRFYLERLSGFNTQRIPTDENIVLFYCEAEQNKKDQRLMAFAEVRETPPRKKQAEYMTYPALKRALLRIMTAMRRHQENYPKNDSFYWSQIVLYIRPLLHVDRDEFLSFLRRVLAGYEQIKLEIIRIYVLMAKPYGDVENLQVEVKFPADLSIEMRYTAPTTPVIQPLSERDLKLSMSRRRGINYPYEVIDLLTKRHFQQGSFEEYGLDPEDPSRLVPATYGKGGSMVAGLIVNITPNHPEGIKRVILLSDGNFGLGCLAEHECRYVLAALDLAEEHDIPLEWFPISSGAKIAMDSGTENLDWTAKVLRRIIEYTQAGGEINIVVDGINVGAQSYWNAEATMMMHTRGCLIMTPRGCMVLTGKGALDYAGSVSAEDNQGIGGLERIMGPNGQVHYQARDLLEACDLLFQYYALTYVAPGHKQPKAYTVDDPHDRNICVSPYSFEATPDFNTIGDIFDPEKNPGKKKPFDMRQIMMALIDQGIQPLERWSLLAGGETTLVYDAVLGGNPVLLVGIQSHPIKRHGFVPNDGPDAWSGGTLFPQSSKKLARALNSASGRRPAVILANLSGFDGSPESLRRLQLEYGAEIGRAVVNFEGPILFCVLSRYHGGAYVVFSNALNPNLKALALTGTYASVIGGAPAAAVVFPREVRKRTIADPRVTAMQEQLKTASGEQAEALRKEYNKVHGEVYSEKQSEIATHFDEVHSVERAKEVGSLDDILDPHQLRPYLIRALESAKQEGS